MKSNNKQHNLVEITFIKTISVFDDFTYCMKNSTFKCPHLDQIKVDKEHSISKAFCKAFCKKLITIGELKLEKCEECKDEFRVNVGEENF